MGKNPDIKINAYGTVVYRGEIMGRVTKEHDGTWRFREDRQVFASERRFITQKAAVNALILRYSGKSVEGEANP